MANDVAYGFIGVQHLFGERVKTVGVETVRGLIENTTRAWNDEIRAIISGWVQETVIAQERVELPGSGSLQPLDEEGWGNPNPVRETGNYIVGYPIQGAGTAWGTNRVSNALMTVSEANRQMLLVQRMDATWLRQHLLGAVLDNGGWTYNDKNLGDTAIQPLANGDSIVYMKNGATQPSTANHYFAQAEAISDAYNPFPTIYDTLQLYPSNDGPYVVYIPTNLRQAIEALDDFVRVSDPDIDPAITRDRIASGSNVNASPGGRVIGRTERVWVVEWRALPNNYMIAVALGAGKFIRMRQWDDNALQGLFPEYHSPDGNLNLNRFVRYAGFGVYNRVAALAYQIGSATYSTPTAYNVPLP